MGSNSNSHGNQTVREKQIFKAGVAVENGSLELEELDEQPETPPEGRIYIYERNGKVRQLDPDGNESELGGGGGGVSDHALAGEVHTESTLADLNAKVSDATLDDESDSRPAEAHAIAGETHGNSTLAELNSKISDADLDAAGTARPPESHGLAGDAHGQATLSGLNSKVSDATLDGSGSARPPEAHALAGEDHNSSTLADLNSKVSDATLDSSGDARPPQDHDNDAHSTNYAPQTELDNHENDTSNPHNVDNNDVGVTSGTNASGNYEITINGDTYEFVS